MKKTDCDFVSVKKSVSLLFFTSTLDLKQEERCVYKRSLLDTKLLFKILTRMFEEYIVLCSHTVSLITSSYVYDLIMILIIILLHFTWFIVVVI